MVFKKRSIGKVVSKYILTGVLLFSSLGFVGCKEKDKPSEPEQSEPTEKEKELQEQLDELKKQIEELKALNEEIKALKEQIEAQKQAEIVELENQIAELNNSLSELNFTIADLNEQIADLENDNAELSSSLTELQNQLIEAQNAYDALNSQKEQLEEQVADLQQQVEDLQQQLDDILYYTVTFDSKGGTAVASQQVLVGALVDNTKISTTRNGYTLLGWKNGEDFWDFEHNTINGPVTLTAIWSANTYAVTLNPNGGTTSQTSYNFTFDANYSLPTPTKTGYTFIGWYEGTKKYSQSGKWATSKPVTLTASWALTNAKITYVYNYDCSYPTEQSVTYNSNYELIIPEREGYTFLGWKNGSETVTSGKWTYVDSITIEAQWSANTYTLTLDSGLGEEPIQTSIVYDSLDELPVCADLNEDRPFAGWFLDGEKPIRLTNELGVPLSNWKLTEDSTLVAKYFHPISNKDDFALIAENNTTVYSLVNDVDLSGFEQIDSFEGTLEGLGYSITGINWTSDETSVGIFKTIKNATFENINFKNNHIEFTGSQDSNYNVGLLASQASGNNTFSEINYENNVIDITLDSASANVGGLVGRAGYLTVENVTSGGEIKAKSLENSVNIGGFVGKCEGTLTSTNYVNKATVIANAYGGVDDETHQALEGVCGGFVGLASSVDLTDTFNKGSVEGYSVKKDLSYTGGLVGKITTKIDLANSDNQGIVVATKYGGGLFGCVAIPGSIEVRNLVHSGIVTDGGENGFLGGLIGRAITSLFVEACCNEGNVCSTDGFSGGLIGSADSSITVEESFNKGTISSTKGSAGGLIGYAVTAVISDCYNNGIVEGQYSAGGILGFIDTYAGISYCYVTGEVRLIDELQNGFVGGFVGSSGNLEISHSFVVALLKGIDGHTSSVIGENSCNAVNVKSASTFKDLSDNDIVDSTSYAQVIDESLLTDSYIENTLRFSNVRWDFEHEGEKYPTLLCFKEQE